MHLAGILVGIFLLLIIALIFVISIKQSLNDRKHAKALVYACKYILDNNYDPQRERPINAIIEKELTLYFRKTFGSDQTRVLSDFDKLEVLKPNQFLSPQYIATLNPKNTKFNKYDLIQTATLTCRSANKNQLTENMVERINEISDLVGIHRIDIKNFIKQVLEYNGD